MALVRNPLMSFDASGQFGQNGQGIVYKTWRGQKIAVNPPPATNSSSTAKQQVIRSYFTSAVAAWKSQTTGVQTAWKSYADGHGMVETGMNLFVGTYIKFMNNSSGTPPTVVTTPPNMT